MSYLQTQLNAFQGDAASSASRLAQKRSFGPSTLSRPSPARPSPTPSNSSTTNKVDLKRKRPEPTNIVYSQPQDTGTGKHFMTQVAYAVEYLKSKDKPISFKDIFDYLSIQDATEQSRLTLERILQTHPKVDFERPSGSGKGTYRFRPTHNVRSADQLQAFLQRQPTAQGVPVRELKDGWPGAVEAIDELEKEHKALVTRNKKDNTPRMIWPNDSSLVHEVEDEFVKMWHQVKLPSTNGDLRRDLIDFGLTPTSQVKAPTNAKGEKKKKKASRRGGKTTNTHMQSILKDFSHMRRA